MTKKLLFALTTTFIVLLMNIMINSEKMEEGTTMNTLKINLAFGDVPTLHPHTGVDLRSRSLEKALFEGLTRLDPTGNPIPAGASKFEMSSSKKEYTFYLRPHVWSNGESVLASDYEKAWKNALLPNSECRYGEYFYIIKNGEKAKKGEISIDEVGVRTLDDRTLQVELEHPAPYFLTLTASALFSPLYRGEMQEPSVFNGPFIIDAWEKEQHLKLIPNPQYWDHENVEKMVIEAYMVKDERVAFDMYEQGQINWIGDPFSPLPKEAIPQLEKAKLLKKKEIARVCLLHLNTREFPLSSKKIRQALDYAIDRQELCNHIFIGQLAHASAVPYPYSLLDADTSILRSHEDKARLLFDEALDELNLSKKDFPTLTFTYSQESLFKNMAQYLKDRWETVLGIKIKLQALEWNVLFSELNRHQFQLSTCFQANFFNDPIYNLKMYEKAAEQVNWSGWENPHYQKLLNEIRVSTDQQKRQQLLKEAEEILMEERPTIPLSTQIYLYSTNDEIENLTLTDLGYVEFKYTHFKKPALSKS
jgi:oligopeptide transport system substrate-binding protein